MFRLFGLILVISRGILAANTSNIQSQCNFPPLELSTSNPGDVYMVTQAMGSVIAAAAYVYTDCSKICDILT